MPFTKIIEQEVTTTNFEDYAFSVHVDRDPHCFADTIDLNFWPKEHDIESECFSFSDEEKQCITDGLMLFFEANNPDGIHFSWEWTTGVEFDIGLFFWKNKGLSDEESEEISDGKRENNLSPERRSTMDSILEKMIDYLTSQGLEKSDISFA